MAEFWKPHVIWEEAAVWVDMILKGKHWTGKYKPPVWTFKPNPSPIWGQNVHAMTDFINTHLKYNNWHPAGYSAHYLIRWESRMLHQQCCYYLTISFILCHVPVQTFYHICHSQIALANIQFFARGESMTQHSKKFGYKMTTSLLSNSTEKSPTVEQCA